MMTDDVTIGCVMSYLMRRALIVFISVIILNVKARLVHNNNEGPSNFE